MESITLLIDRQIARLRLALTESVVLSIEGFFFWVAGMATPVAGVVGLVISLVVAIRMDSLAIFLSGFAWLVALLFLYYMGSKARTLCLTTIRNNPSSVAGQAFLDIAVVTVLTVCVASLAAGTYLSVRFSTLWYLATALGVVAFLLYTVGILLNPRLISTEVEASTSAGLDGISNIVMGYKIYLRLSTILFGLLPMLGGLLLIASLSKAFGEPDEILGSGIAGLAGFIVVLSGLAAPWFIYITFVFTYLFFDVLRSILLLGRSVAPPVQPSPPVPEPADPAAARTSEPDPLPARVIRKWAIGGLILVAAVAGIIEGKVRYYAYQEEREWQRIEEAQEKEENERLAREKAEQARRIAEVLVKARKHVGGDAVDLLLEPIIHGAVREILRTEDNLRAFVSYFALSDKVVESDGLIVGRGCTKDKCASLKAILTVDVATGAVGAAVNTQDRILYFGYGEADAPPTVRKWALSVR
jgi:hypothetical protein